MIKKVIFFLIVILIHGACDLDNTAPATILVDTKKLIQTKIHIQKNDPTLLPAFNQLIKEADQALQEGPFSVTHKEKLPPSGDQHDYASYSRYWWPDPDKVDGLPYIRRDGETNPKSQSLNESDRQRIGALARNCETLGLAYYLTAEEKYAEKVAELLRVWFLDPTTRMNPNVNHAQCRPGHNNGSKSGILDGRLLVSALEGSLLIKGSKTLNDKEYKNLKEWAEKYFKWLTTNQMALDEAASKNNHGSYYDAQAIYFALYSENYEAATLIAKEFNENRILSQIQNDGSMPEEIARTRPLFYSIYNLHAMFLVAYLAEKVDVDIWKAKDNNSRLRKGLDFLVPYSDSNKKWPHPTLGDADRMELFPILQMANHAYPDGGYLNSLKKLPKEKSNIHRANLVFPLMR